MSELVLWGIGALVMASLKKFSEKKFLTPNDSANLYLRNSNINIREIGRRDETFTEDSSPLETVAVSFPARPSVPIDWKRFWELFSSDRDLSESEKLEMNLLKEKLNEMHRILESESKRRAEDLKRTIQFRLADLKISDDRGEYIVGRDDYKRGSQKERDYIRLHKNFLFRTYDNRCAKCRDDSNGLDLDHFFFSKNEGGCFQMLHRGGFKVNNAIPLCESCNRSKSDRHFKSFFSPHELLHVMECNLKMNERLNQKRILEWIRR